MIVKCHFNQVFWLVFDVWFEIVSKRFNLFIFNYGKGVNSSALKANEKRWLKVFEINIFSAAVNKRDTGTALLLQVATFATRRNP